VPPMINGPNRLICLVRSVPNVEPAPPSCCRLATAKPCSSIWMDNGAPHCIAFGGLRVDDAIENALLTVVGPGAIAAATAAEKQAGQRRDQVREALGRDLEAARYAADRTFRQYDAADPANRLVAGELEARWNRALTHVAEVEAKIAAHDAAMPVAAVDPLALGLLASNLKTVWSAPTTDARLTHRAIEKLVELAKREGVELRQSYLRVAKRPAIMVGRYTHAHQFNGNTPIRVSSNQHLLLL
jgi:hypothetical protein